MASLKKKTLLIACGLLMLGFVLFRAGRWFDASRQEPQAYLVLGGNAVREVFSTGLAKAHPDRVILISGGSPDPCLWLMFQKKGSPMQRIWTEHCSQNTFENFVYSMPLLEKMGVRKIALVTDYPQADRALPIAQIVFASHGMAVEFQNVPGQSPQDSKPMYEHIGLIVMAAGWAVSSQAYQPICSSLTHLPDVDMKAWYKKGFECQMQTGVRSSPPLP